MWARSTRDLPAPAIPTPIRIAVDMVLVRGGGGGVWGECDAVVAEGSADRLPRHGCQAPTTGEEKKPEPQKKA